MATCAPPNPTADPPPTAVCTISGTWSYIGGSCVAAGPGDVVPDVGECRTSCGILRQDCNCCQKAQERVGATYGCEQVCLFWFANCFATTFKTCNVVPIMPTACFCHRLIPMQFVNGFQPKLAVSRGPRTAVVTTWCLDRSALPAAHHHLWRCQTHPRQYVAQMATGRLLGELVGRTKVGRPPKVRCELGDAIEPAAAPRLRLAVSWACSSVRFIECRCRGL